jgi:hypothetical protein
MAAMEHDARHHAPGKSSTAADVHAGAPAVGKTTQVDRAMQGAGPTAHAAAAGDSPLTSVTDLAAAGQLKHHVATQYLKGPNGTALKVDISARMFGSSDHGSAELVGGTTSVDHGKPTADVTYRYQNHFFTIGLTGDGKNAAS